MKSFPILCAALALALATGASQAADRRESRDVDGFSSVTLAAPVDMDIVQGDRESLVLEGDEADLARIETVVESGSLKIRTRERLTLGDWLPRPLFRHWRVGSGENRICIGRIR